MAPTLRSTFGCALVSIGLSCTVTTVDAPPEKAAPEKAAPEKTAPEKAAPEQTPQPTQLPSPSPTVARAPSGLELVEAGAEPRRSLRPELRTGAQQRFELTMKLRMGVALGESEVADAAVPTVRATVVSRVADVTADGGARLVVDLSDVAHEPAADASKRVVDAMDRAVVVLGALEGEMDVGPDGVARAIRLTLREGDSKDVRHVLEAVVQVFAQLFAPRPDAPVGVGGRWRTVTVVSMHGVDVQQTAEYRVAELGEPNARVTFDLTQGRTTQIEGETYSAAARGEITLDPAGLAPRVASSTSRSTMHTHVDVQGKRQAAVTQLDLELEIRPVE